MSDDMRYTTDPAESAQTTPPTTTNGGEASTQMLLREAVLTRHSARLYLPQPVPRPMLDKAFELARHSPSDSNTQVWRMFVVTGEALKGLKTALMARAAADTEPRIPGPPPEFVPYLSALGKEIYGVGWGIPRDDLPRRREAVLRNFEFFGAPVGIIVCMSRALRGQAAISVGMYVQTLLLAFTELGIQSCVQIAIAGYPDLVKRVVGIPEDLEVLCGISVGYEDVDAGVNKVRSDREPVDKTTVWVE
ncbi:Nitroreductase-like protein [Xylaria intraflava]|nr:Nitroreductase-like protein [Xylaria intraflava]